MKLIALIVGSLLFSPVLAPCVAPFDPYPPVYYPISTHWLAGVSVLGDSVELEDGSVWQISRYDHREALDWLSSDPLTITQNRRWFSSCEYKIVNQTSGASVEANLLLGPVKDNLHTLYITAIDLHYGVCTLMNRSGHEMHWQVAPSDLVIFQNWCLNDAVIVGQNSGWESSYEGLLINVNMNRSVLAHWIP